MISHTLHVIHRQWFRFKRGTKSLTLRVFRVKDASERVARGFALGLIVNFLPTFGLGVLISGFIARILGGNVIAGFAGGATLTFFWPFLFYLNVRMGSLLFRPEVKVEELEDVTEASMNALMWGRTFMTGAVANMLIAGFAAYVLVFFLHSRLRPAALAWFRRRRLRKSQAA